jgi:hypothetical protein
MNDELRTHLGANERLLWSGQPRQGIIFRPSDIYMIPFSLLWGGFAFFWEYNVIRMGAPWFFMLWGVPFVLVGAYMIIGRFFYDAQVRKRTHYALTNERVIILSGMFQRQQHSVNLKTISDLTLTETNGNGTIGFGAGTGLAAVFGGFVGLPGSRAHMGPAFHDLPNAKAVYDQIRNAQRSDF